VGVPFRQPGVGKIKVGGDCSSTYRPKFLKIPTIGWVTIAKSADRDADQLRGKGRIKSLWFFAWTGGVGSLPINRDFFTFYTEALAGSYSAKNSEEQHNDWKPISKRSERPARNLIAGGGVAGIG
jgi:hypothetical protein